MNSTATENLEPLAICEYVDEWYTEFYTCNRCQCLTMLYDNEEHMHIPPTFCPRCGVRFTKVIGRYGQCSE